jgi:hypothetical protein
MLLTDSGKAAGLVITGVQTAPEVLVRVTPSICAAVAAPRPLLLRLIVQTLAADGPDLVVIVAVRIGLRTILALTVTGPVTLTVVAALVVDATRPVQELNM